MSNTIRNYYKKVLRTGYIAPYLFSLILILLSCQQENPNERILGTWGGIYNDLHFKFVFRADRTCSLEFPDMHNQSKVILVEGEYELNGSKQPIPLSIRKIRQLDHSLHSIIQFGDNDNIYVSFFSRRWRLRPLTLQSGAILTLTKVKQGQEMSTTNKGVSS